MSDDMSDDTSDDAALREGPIHDALVAPDTLLALLRERQPAVVDCCFDLSDPDAGRRSHARAHLPGAVYASLDSDLSDRSIQGRGRHPLPSGQRMRESFERLGISTGRQVVVYDAGDGSLAAARLWWMLRYMGHRAAAVLDGGLREWRRLGHPIESGPVLPVRGRFTGRAQAGWTVTAGEVCDAPLLVDARAPARYRGESEPLDPVAGHIPGAVNRFFGANVDESGCFHPAKRLAREFGVLLGDCPAEQAVLYCGSGVSACHHLLAMAHAGLALGRLYPGSWSEWCADRSRPVATGDA